jgi:hypothetical protein
MTGARQLPVNRVSVITNEISVLPTPNSSIHIGKKMPLECRKKLEAKNPIRKE